MRQSSSLSTVIQSLGRSSKRSHQRVLVGASAIIDSSNPRCYHASHSSETVYREKETSLPAWRDPGMRSYLFWNREDWKEKDKYKYLLEISPEAIRQEARILSLSDPQDPAGLETHTLPPGASLVGVGDSMEELQQSLSTQKNPNVLFVSPSCPRAATVLPQVLQAFPSIQWVHCRSAGIDFVESDELVEITEARNIRLTNAKGQFSSSLAEYALFACSYFAKDLPRLMRNQKAKIWDPFNVEELRGKT